MTFDYEAANTYLATLDDDGLATLRDLIDRRVKSNHMRQLHRMGYGTRVRITNTRPKYLNGMMATVVRVNQTRAVVRLDYSAGRFDADRDVTVPAACLQRVD